MATMTDSSAHGAPSHLQPPTVPSGPLGLGGSPNDIHDPSQMGMLPGSNNGVPSLPPGAIPQGMQQNFPPPMPPGLPVNVPMLPGQVSVGQPPQGGPSDPNSASARKSTQPHPSLTLGELYLLTKPPQPGWDGTGVPPQPMDPNAPPIPVADAIMDHDGVMHQLPGQAQRSTGPRRTQRGNKRNQPYPSDEQVEEDEEEEGPSTGPGADIEFALRAADTTPPGSAKRGGKAGGGAPRPRFTCSYPGCEKSFTREGDRVRHNNTTLHRGETLSTQRIAEIMSETRETHRQYCIRCKRIMLRVNSRRRHEENPQACGSRRGMPKDVIEGGRVRDDVLDPSHVVVQEAQDGSVQVQAQPMSQAGAVPGGTMTVEGYPMNEQIQGDIQTILHAIEAANAGVKTDDSNGVQLPTSGPNDAPHGPTA